MIRSVLFGVIMERYLFAHEPARSVPTADLEPLLADVLAAAIGTPAAGAAGPTRPEDSPPPTPTPAPSPPSPTAPTATAP